MKDVVLKGLVECGVHCAQDVHKSHEDFNIDRDCLMEILDHFERLGFIYQQKFLGGLIHITMHPEGFDFYNHGGFHAQEELLQKNLERLLLEIESLKPHMPDKINTITAIIGNIATALSLVIPTRG